jgi:hypothetical protein
MQDLQDMLDDTTTQVMDPHRKGDFAKAPDAAQGDLRKELLVIAGKGWTGANANFSKMEGVIKRAESLLRVADTTIQAAQNNVQGATNRGQAALQTITDTTTELENEYGRIVAVFGNKNTAGHLISFIANKSKNVAEATKMDDKHAYLDQVVNQLKLVSGKTKQVYAGLDQVRQQAVSTANGVDKANRGHQLIKPILVRLAKVAKDCETAKKTWESDLAKAVKGFESMKTMVGTDKKAAEKVSEKAKENQ